MQRAGGAGEPLARPLQPITHSALQPAIDFIWRTSIGAAATSTGRPRMAPTWPACCCQPSKMRAMSP
jgi:hypothetical protein